MSITDDEAMQAETEAVCRPAQPPKNLPRDAGSAVTTFMRHTSPLILITALIVDGVWRLSLGGWRWLDLWVVLGLIAYWPLNEWLIHVFILHQKPVMLPRWLGGLRIDYPVARSHRQHHGDPWNLQLVFIPLHIFPLTLPALFTLAFWVAPDTRIALTWLTAYAALSLHYEWSHYLAHIGWQPKLRHYQRRVREHRLHHFRNERYWWGVSMGSGDRWLGTAPDAGEVERSPTTGIVHAA